MKTLATNKKALFNYDVLDEFEAGIMLNGWEVKSIKDGRISLKESYVTLRGGEAWLLNANVAKWPGMANTTVGVETRERKLLLNRDELNKLQKAMSIKGNAIVVINVHLSKNTVKLKIALARGRKMHDKRQVLKERDQIRSIQRDRKSFNI